MPSFFEDEDDYDYDHDYDFGLKDSGSEIRRPRKWPNTSFFESVTGDVNWQDELLKVHDVLDRQCKELHKEVRKLKAEREEQDERMAGLKDAMNLLRPSVDRAQEKVETTSIRMGNYYSHLQKETDAAIRKAHTEIENVDASLTRRINQLRDEPLADLRRDSGNQAAAIAEIRETLATLTER